MDKQYVLNKKNTQTKAIRLKCSNCIVDPLDKGTELDQITNCKDRKCALWEWRPLNTGTKLLMKEEKISLMNPEELAKYKEKANIARERLVNNMYSS